MRSSKRRLNSWRGRQAGKSAEQFEMMRRWILDVQYRGLCIVWDAYPMEAFSYYGA